MVGPKAGKSVKSAPSCGECYRRKQKCSRQWPCNHCQSRRIPHLCKFPQKESPKKSRASVDPPRKSSSDQDISSLSSISKQLENSPVEIQSVKIKDELRVLGYLPDNENLPLGDDTTPVINGPQTIQPSVNTSSEMQKVFQILPPKPYTDILVQQFLEVTNFNYYCLYPPIFSTDYATWWTDRANGNPVTPEFTCLLVRVCACSAQYLDADNTQRLETELGESIQTLSENFHYAARQLSNTIGPGKGGISQVHQLFLTSAWFKSEGLFVESWHALSSCVHEAQEQGMHKNSTKRGLSEFDTEMRRRSWCLLNQWDWQMSMLLSRPLIISQSSSTIELPSMTLESEIEGPPAPIAHTASQYKLGRMIIKTSLFTEEETSSEEADSIRSMINGWLASLPPAYRETEPDLQWDESYLYVPFQRRQMHAIAYMTMLQPFKRFLTKNYNKKSSEKDKSYRASAVDIALHLMTVSQRLFDQVFPTNAKFHLVGFLLFDTAAFLCSAVIHDQDRSLPRQDEILQAIAVACSLLQKLAQTTKAGAICYPILIKLAGSLSKSSKPPTIPKPIAQISDQSMNDLFTPPDLGGSSLEDLTPPISWPPSLESLDSTDIFFPASLDYPVPDMETPPLLDMSDLSSIDIGQFDQIWDWQNLDLTLLPSMSAHMPTEDSGSV